MTALSTDLSARVAKLLPRLASDHQGEVAAVAAALARTLESGGCDLHDLAAHVAEGPREIVIYRDREPICPGPRDYGDWRPTWQGSDPRRRHKAQVARVRAAPPGFLSPWEVEFTGSLARQLDQGRALSCRQETILRDLYARLEEHFA